MKHDAKRYKETKAHEENTKAWTTSSSKTMPLSLHFSGDSKIERVPTVEAKLVTFLVEHDLPYSLSEVTETCEKYARSRSSKSGHSR